MNDDEMELEGAHAAPSYPEITDNRYRTVQYVRTIDGDTFRGLWTLVPPISVATKLEANIRVRGWSAAELKEPEGEYMLHYFSGKLVAARFISVKPYTMNRERIVCDVYIDGELFLGPLQTALMELRRK